VTDPLRIDASDDGIPLVTFSNRVMIHTQFLSDEMDDSTLFRGESPGEGKLISHAVILKEQDARVYFQGRGVIEI
jgi:hypothetical protein